MKFLSLLVDLAIFILSNLGAQAAAKHSNIVFILVDDLGYGELSCHEAGCTAS